MGGRGSASGAGGSDGATKAVATPSSQKTLEEPEKKTESTVQKLEKAGGKEWESDDGRYHRVYFDDLPGWYGLQAERYGTGNISSAKLDGQKISNSQARKIESALYGGKVWYNVKTGEYESKGISESAHKKIVARIKEKSGVE